MGITLLTLSRQQAAGKITTADYRAQRRILVDEQIFQLEERTMPGVVKESEAIPPEGLTDATQPPPAGYGVNPGNQYSEPVPAIRERQGLVTAPVITGADTTTFSPLKRLEGLTQPVPAVDRPSGLAKKGLYAGLFAGLLSLVVLAYILTGRSEPLPAPVEDPLKQATELLLENPDWQVEDLQAYRQQLSGQTHGLTYEQTLLLGSVETYLSVPLSSEYTVLDQEVQQLKQELIALNLHQ